MVKSVRANEMASTDEYSTSASSPDSSLHQQQQQVFQHPSHQHYLQMQLHRQQQIELHQRHHYQQYELHQRFELRHCQQPGLLFTSHKVQQQQQQQRDVGESFQHQQQFAPYLNQQPVNQPR